MFRPLLIIFTIFSQLQAESFFNNYLDNKELAAEIGKLTHPSLNKQILIKTAKGNPIHLITLSNSEDPKPAILIVGDTNSNSPVGCEIIINWLNNLIKDETKIKELLDRNTLYIIPRPAPDALENVFGKIISKNNTNSRPSDDDKDHQIDEDPYEDLNKDGFITLMRIKDDLGEYQPHPDMPLVMIKSNKGKDKYKLYSEGIDNDKDEQFNEDPLGGVAFNRNFTYDYPYFGRAAGPHQISEPETKAIADFAFSHPEIFLVLSFGPEDNMVNTWKEDPKKKKIRNKVTIFKEDEEWLAHYSAQYKKIFKPAGAPPKTHTKGSFAKWAYFHLGKLSITINPWWIPINQNIKVNNKKNIDEVKRAIWLQKNRPQALTQWVEIKHPDFKNSKVEVGGIKPGFDIIPDIKTCNDKSLKFTKFIEEALKQQPKINIKEASLKKIGNSVFKLEITLYNDQKIPSASKIGQHSRKVYPLNISLDIGENWEVYNGSSRTQSRHLNSGESNKLEWTLIKKDKAYPKIDIKIRCPHLHDIDFKVEAQK